MPTKLFFEGQMDNTVKMRSLKVSDNWSYIVGNVRWRALRNNIFCLINP